MKAREWKLSYRSKLVAAVCGLVVVTGASITWLAYRGARESTEVLVRGLFREVSSHAVTHARGHVLRAEPLVESLRQLAGHGLDVVDSDRLAGQLLAFLKGNPGLSWISYGDEEGGFTGAYRPIDGGLRINQSRIVKERTKLVEHDVLADGSLKLARTEEDSGYDPRTRPFYRKAKQEGRLTWQPPYVFFNQGVPGVSCAAPVFDVQGKMTGVLSIDFDLTALSDFVSRLSMSEHSKVMLFTTDEVLLAHPNQRKLTAAGEWAAGKLLKLQDTGDPAVEAYRQAMRGEREQHQADDDFHFFEFQQEGTDYLASATTFRVGDDLTWVVGAVAPKEDFLGGVWRSQVVALVAAGGALVLAVMLAAWLAGSVSRPVVAMVDFMGQVGAGDLDARADFGGSREFRQVSEALNRMIGDLRDRVRLRLSLDVAMEVQQRLLPQRPPTIQGLDVAGHSTYCDETGGDYYDFLVLDKSSPHQLLVALGDVMGHGVAAALIMAGVRAVLRDRADATSSLAHLFGRLNALLAADHEGTRFMTMHLAVVDVKERVYRFVSAGHDPAILYDPASDGFVDIDAGDIPLGIMEDQEFTEHSHGPLLPGQVIFIGTDGVWEMPNEQGEQFGKSRLRDALRACAGKTGEEIAQTLRDRLVAFRGASRPVDDVTFVVVKIAPA